MSAYSLGPSGSDADPDWPRIRAALIRATPGLREASRDPGVVPSTKSPFKDAPLVGTAHGRLWEVIYYRPSFFSPDRLLSVVTAMRWDDPARMLNYETPWMYIGGRPRIFSRLGPDVDRIIERQRRAERSLVGYKTGDAEFDRRWAFYAYRSNPSRVLKDAAQREWLEGLAEIRPSRGDEMPVIASLGTTVSLALVVGDAGRTEPQARTLLQSFGQLLDAVEASTGSVPASQLSLPMDLMPDGSGYAAPTLRLRCSWCGQETHPRFVSEFQTEICALCRRGLYNTG